MLVAMPRMHSPKSEIRTAQDDCCGTDMCPHTLIEHNDHMGWLVDGRLRCRTSEAEPLFECSLAVDSNMKCELVSEADNHVHGPDCGHEMVPHGDHHDFLVGSRLHHVVDDPGLCCERGCLGEVVKSTVVDHGFVHVKKRHGGAECSTPTEQASLIEKAVVTDIYSAGICCPSEVPVIHKILESLPGVVSVDITVMTKNVHVKHYPEKTSPALLVSALNGAGLQASLGKRDTTAGTTPLEDLYSPFQPSPLLGVHQERGAARNTCSPFVRDLTCALCLLDAKGDALPFNVILSGLFLAVSVFGFVSHEVEWLKFVALAAVLVGCPIILIRAVASLRRLLLDINVLMLVGTLGAIALQEFHEAGAIIFLYGISQWLEDRCLGKARSAIAGLKELQPEFATSAVDSALIPVNKIEVTDVLIVRPGDRVAVDGTVVSGSSAVDESLLTGESKPVAKRQGDRLLSGSVNSGSGSLRMEATSRVTDSTVALLAQKVEETAMQSSHTERTLETFSKFYTPLVVVTAIVVALLPLIITSLDLKKVLTTSLVLLVTSCPCALVISAPVTTVCGISRAAQKSILIKGGTALEALARLKAMTFDKTGTLTEGHCDVVGILKRGKMTEEEILNWASAMEVHSSHPLAAAIVGYAAALGEHHGSAAVSVEDLPGLGLVGTRDGISLMVGNWSLMVQQNVQSDSSLEQLESNLGQQGQKACFVAVDKRLVGTIVVADRIRPTAKFALSALKNLKLDLGLLTGDTPEAAYYVAQSVGLNADSVHASLIPEQKAALVNQFREQHGPVGHVGDGINDSLALAAADVGIAMGVGGSTMAIEAADVALFSNEITAIATAVKISQMVRWIIYENIVFAIAVKLGVIVCAFLGHAKLWHAVIADVGSALLVILNGLRVLRYGRLKKGAPSSRKSSCISKSMSQRGIDKLELAEHGACCHAEREGLLEMTRIHSCCSKDATGGHTPLIPVVVGGATEKKGCCSKDASKGCCTKKQAD